MTENHDKWVCKSCGHVREMDIGWSEARDPAPEVNMGSMLPPPPDVAPRVKSDTPSGEYVDVGLGFALGDCTECGGHSWQRVSLSSLEKDDPIIERPKRSENLPSEKGFQEIIPPSPEISQNTVMMHDTYTEPPTQPDIAPRPPGEPVEPGVSGSMGTTPLGGEESNPNMMLPFGADVPVTDLKYDDAQAPKKDKYVCEECGGILEVEMDQVELPRCTHCGSSGWLKESF
ncbi:MAG TPA: hypothetical protein VK905_00945 [Bacillota bacterium]|nr:hypothetical protein [Bacillota bacterium]